MTRLVAHRETMTSLGAATRDDLAAVLRRHALAETVLVAALATAGLVCALHDIPACNGYSCFENGKDKNERGNLQHKPVSSCYEQSNSRPPPKNLPWNRETVAPGFRSVVTSLTSFRTTSPRMAAPTLPGAPSVAEKSQNSWQRTFKEPDTVVSGIGISAPERSE